MSFPIEHREPERGKNPHEEFVESSALRRRVDRARSDPTYAKVYPELGVSPQEAERKLERRSRSRGRVTQTSRGG